MCRHRFSDPPPYLAPPRDRYPLPPSGGIFLIEQIFYNGGMITSIEPKFGTWNADILKAAFHTDSGIDGPLQAEPNGFILLVGPRSLNTTMLTAIARLGEGAPVRVLDGGNRFNAYTLARMARGRPQVLERITVSRAFTCYQVLSLLESTPATPSPFVVLDLLNTFYDESVQAGERKRLLRACLTQLKRLEAAAGGAVSVHPPAVPSQAALELLGLLQAASAEVYFVQPAPAPPEPLRLF